MQLHTLSLTSFVIVSACFLPLARAGGGEIYCINSASGTEVHERWIVPPAGVEWTMNLGPNAGRIAPSFPTLTCAGGSLGSAPAGQSLMRAAETWSNAIFPGSSAPASPFHFTTSPSTTSFILCPQGPPSCGAPPMIWPIVGCNGENLVSAWEPASSFQFFGGQATVALAAVIVDGATGLIEEADIAFNAQWTNASGAPYWSFVEFNDLASDWYASNPIGPVWLAPVSGYVDLQAVATHEFGHALGLGHTFVDGNWLPSEGTMPTMLDTGHTTSPLVQLATLLEVNCTSTTFTIDAATTSVGGLLSATARTLELDDIAALASTYPPVGADPALGKISGTVRNGAAQPVRGAHVVLIGRFDTDVRQGTLTGSGGGFELPGLKPGDYYVYVEPVDIGAGGLFEQSQIPNYVSIGCGQSGNCAGTLTTVCGCITSVVQHRIEFWDDLESGAENSPMRVTPITVTAGQTTGSIDLIVEALPDRMTVRRILPTTSTPSSHGIRVAPAAGVDPTLEFSVQTGALSGGTVVLLYVNPERQHRNLLGELLQVSTSGTGGFPLLLQTTVPAGGASSVTFQLMIPDNFAHHNLIAQAAARIPNQAPYLSNPVIVLVEQP